MLQAYLSLIKFMRVWGYFYKHLLFERDAFICGSKGFQGWLPSFNLTLVSCFKRAASLATWKDLARQLDSRDSRWKEATRLLVWPWHCVLHPGTSYCSIPRIIFWFVSSEIYLLYGRRSILWIRLKEIAENRWYLSMLFGVKLCRALPSQHSWN